MKIHFKMTPNLKSVLFLFLIVLFFFGCEKEETNLELETTESIEEVQDSGLSISIVGNDKIQENQELAKRLQRFSRVNKNQTQSKNVTSNKYDFSIDTNHVSYISNQEEDYESYTFPVYRDEFNPSILENLLISVYPNDKFKALLITYKKPKGADSFEELIKIEKIEDEGFISGLFAKESAYCVILFTEWCNSGDHNSSTGYDTCIRYESSTQSYCVGGGGGSTTYTPPNYGDNNETQGGTSGSSSGTNGSGTGSSTRDTTTPTESPMTQLLNCMPNLLANDGATTWLNNNALETRIINDYLKEKSCSNEAKDFAELVVEAFLSGVNIDDVDFDEQIIDELKGKAKCVYNKLKNSSTSFKNKIKKFDGEFPVSHLKFEIDENETSNTRKAYTRPPSNYVIDIVLNGNSSKDASYQKRPNLLIAKTIIHEVIHAEMFRKLLSLANSNGSIDVNLVRQMLNQGNYPGMLDYYKRHGNIPNSNWQHQQMAAHYRETIARVLQEFDTGIEVDDNTQPDQLYLDLAWEGLIYSDITAWKDIMTDTERTRIKNVISNYISNNVNQTCTE